MNNYLLIPDSWNCYPDDLNCFITYYGDIFCGTPLKHQSFPDRIYIVPNYKLQRFQDSLEQEQTSEDLKKLGHEITDVKIIRKVFKYNELGSFPVQPISPNGFLFKKMFIFGAAASTYCVSGESREMFQNSALKPPTGYEIFNLTYSPFFRKYPGAEHSIPNFIARKKDIEGCLEEEWQEYREQNNLQMANRHINIQFYLFELMRAVSKEVTEHYSGENLYSLLFYKLQRYFSRFRHEKLSVVSFNYDTILEHFMTAQLDFNIISMRDYINWGEHPAVLFKPHGSCDWGWKFRKDRIDNATQETIARLLYENKIQPWQIYYDLLGDVTETVDDRSWNAEKRWSTEELGRLTINKSLIHKFHGKSQDVFFPALLLPYRDKDEFVMPDDHLTAMELAFQRVEDIYLIGWKGNEHLFNQLLFKKALNLKRIIIVNPQPKEVKNNLSQYIDILNYKITEVEDFEAFVLEFIDKEIEGWKKI